MGDLEDLFLMVSRFSGLVLLLAAFFVFRYRGRAKLLAAGIACYGVFLLIAANERALPVDLRRQMEFLLMALFLVGLVLIPLGAFQLSGGGPSAFRSAGNSAHAPPMLETPMASLVIPRNETNSHTRAEAVRDDLYKRIEQICKRSGVNVVGYKSLAKSGVVWLRFDYWLPQESENLTLRAYFAVTVERFDYHRFEHVLTLEVVKGLRKKERFGFVELLDRDIELLNLYLTRGTTFPRLSSRRVRTWPLQLWRPRNKVDQLGIDWPLVGLSIVFVLGLGLLAPVPLIGFLAIAAAVVGIVWYRLSQNTYILTTGKPTHDPRQLIRMDFWQANIEGLGPRQDEVRAALLERLGSSNDKGIGVTPELIWYAGIDGKVEREQIVCGFRRALGFLHVEAYGEDLYVGWDSHVNVGTWVEQTLARGIDKQSGKLAVANRVVPGRQILNEYDITDVNFLTEWLHSSVVRQVKVKMEEHKIDQEIDFTIQRESRKDALSSTADGDKPEPQRRDPLSRFASRLKRVN